LARILASKPAALQLDEPFSALDSYLKWQVELELRARLKEFAGPILFVTHGRDEVYPQCRQVCILDRGTSQPMQTVEALFHAQKPCPPVAWPGVRTSLESVGKAAGQKHWTGAWR